MKRKILIVEDNTGLSQMQKDWFAHDAVTAMNEPITRSLIRKMRFDLICRMCACRKGTASRFWSGCARRRRTYRSSSRPSMFPSRMWCGPSNWERKITCPNRYTVTTCWSWPRCSVRWRRCARKKRFYSTVQAPRFYKWRNSPSW